MSKSFFLIGSGSEIAGYFENRLYSEDKRVYGVSVNPGNPYWGYPKEFLTGQIIKYQPDVIINFVGAKLNDFKECFESNVLVSKNIFDAAIDAEFKGRIILIGSAAEYGAQTKYSEDCTEKPQNIYGLTKLLQKDLFRYFTNNFNIDACYVRPFNVLYENISDEKLFIGSLNNQIKKNLKKESDQIVFGDLNSYRDYILINDLYDAIMAVIDKGRKGEVYNIGMGEAIYIRKFVNDMLGFFDLKIKIVTKQIDPIGGIKDPVIADISKISQLGWECKYNKDELSKAYFTRFKDSML